MPATAHGVLTAGQVKSVYIDPGNSGLVVVNRSLQGAIWVRIDGQDPAPGVAGSYVVLGARDFLVPRAIVRAGNLEVRMISDAECAYSVEAIA